MKITESVIRFIIISQSVQIFVDAANSSSTVVAKNVTTRPKVAKKITQQCIPVNPKCNAANKSGCSKCAFTIPIPAATHKYIGGLILVLFVLGQTIHYFYLEEKKAKVNKSKEPDGETGASPDEHADEEEQERRERLAYGISTNTYLVAECQTPGGTVTKVLEKRPRRSLAVAPPITPASINGLYESRAKTAKKEEAVVCLMRVSADKWGRGTELASLINDSEVPTSLLTAEEKARFVMELVQQHAEKMTEQKVFLHGFLVDERSRMLCGSENLEGELFSDVRLELKLEMTVPVNLLICVFSVRVEPIIEKNVQAAARISDMTSIPNRETPRNEKAGKSNVSSGSLEDAKPPGASFRKLAVPSPDKKKTSTDKRESSRRRGVRKTSDLSDLVPLLQQMQQSTQQGERHSKERMGTPVSNVPSPPPEKLPTSGQLPPSLVEKKKREGGGTSQKSSG